MNGRPDVERPFERPLHEENVGIWWADELFDSTSVNFVGRFLSPDELRTLVDDRGWPHLGPSRLAELVDLHVAGNAVPCGRIDYRVLPSFRSIRCDLPDVRITLHGWALSFEELEAHARALERLELGMPLFRAMATAQARSDARFEEIMRDEHDAADDA